MRAGVVWQVVDDVVVLLDLDSSTYFRLNSAGSTLWRLLSDGATDEVLAAELGQAHGLDDGRARADVKAFVDDLTGRGLVT